LGLLMETSEAPPAPVPPVALAVAVVAPPPVMLL
jgi:hypothetical protein